MLFIMIMLIDMLAHISIFIVRLSQSLGATHLRVSYICTYFFITSIFCNRDKRRGPISFSKIQQKRRRKRTHRIFIVSRLIQIRGMSEEKEDDIFMILFFFFQISIQKIALGYKLRLESFFEMLLLLQYILYHVY